MSVEFRIVIFYNENSGYETFGLTLKESIFKYIESKSKYSNCITFKAYTSEDPEINEFLETEFKTKQMKQKDFRKTRGYGYMLWKPFIINKEMNEMEKERTKEKTKTKKFLIYLDADMQINNFELFEKFLEFIEEKNKSIFFRVGEYTINNYKDKNWSRKDLISYFEKNNETRYTGEMSQIMSGIQIYNLNNDDTSYTTIQNLIRKYLDLTILYGNETSETSGSGGSGGSGSNCNCNDYQHRHDQSVLSCIINSGIYYRIDKPNYEIYNAPTQFGIEDNKKNTKFSIFKNNLNVFVNRGVSGNGIQKIPKVSIIVPTTGKNLGQLKRCLLSIQNQTYVNTECILVLDGISSSKKENIKQLLSSFQQKRVIRTFDLPMNVGRDGWYGYNTYASIPYLLRTTDWVVFLDEDNFVSPNHVQSYIKTIKQVRNLDWVYCLRKVIFNCQPKDFYIDNEKTKGKDFIFDSNSNLEFDLDFLPFYKDQQGFLEDNCESLGDKSSTIIHQNDYLVDTSCYFLKRNVAISSSPVWKVCVEKGIDGDRGMFSFLKKNFPNYTCSNEYTLYYQTGSGEKSVSYDFFIKGNQKVNRQGEFFSSKQQSVIENQNIKKQNQKPIIYLFHFSLEATEEVFLSRQKYTNTGKIDPDIVYKEWQMTLINELSKKYYLANGYTAMCKGGVPKGSTILVHLCAMETLPLKYILDPQNEFYKIIYTIEGPNIRHSKQWDYNFLNKFDKVYTYWEPLLENSNNSNNSNNKKFVYMPFIHRLDFSNPEQSTGLFLNGTKHCRKTICYVGENRNLAGNYFINTNGRGKKTKLTCLDILKRQHFVLEMSKRKMDIEVYGSDWEKENTKNIIKVVRNTTRYKDKEYNYQIFSRYTFTLIVENCDAEGYVSEKIYDALVAGSIPIYIAGENNINYRMKEILSNSNKKCYIDASNMTPEQLCNYINKLSFKQIKFMKESILKHREDILKKVSVNNYCF